MSMKKSAVLLACVGAWALVVTGPSSVASPPHAFQPNPGASPTLTARAATASSLSVGDADTALTSKNGETVAPEPIRAASDEDPAQLVGIIVRFREGNEHEGVLASIREAVAGVVPDASVTVEYEYRHALQGVALRAPAGSLEAIRGVNGVASAFFERESRVWGGADSEGGIRTSRLATQDPDNLSSQVMMRTDRVAQKGEGMVIAIVDTGVDMTHPALNGALSGSPALDSEKVAALLPQLGEGKNGTYVSEKFPFAYDYADGDNDASPAPDDSGSHGTHVAGIAAGNADKIMGTAPEA